LVGYVSDAHHGSAASSFDWILIAAGLIPLAGMVLVLLLVRNTRATEQGLVRPI
jgi:ACS family hexuronate transporter-like MFS transporter